MPRPARRATHSGRRASAITRSQERRARASIPSNLADLPRESIDASVLMSCMMVASVSAFGKGLDSAKALLGGLQVKYNRGEAASFEESLVEESVGVPASFSNPPAPASASASAVDFEVASYLPFGPSPGHVPLTRSDAPSPPPKPAEVIDLTSSAPSPVQATSPPVRPSTCLSVLAVAVGSAAEQLAARIVPLDLCFSRPLFSMTVGVD